jgi:hypothetical protein
VGPHVAWISAFHPASMSLKRDFSYRIASEKVLSDAVIYDFWTRATTFSTFNTLCCDDLHPNAKDVGSTRQTREFLSSGSHTQCLLSNQLREYNSKKPVAFAKLGWDSDDLDETV